MKTKLRLVNTTTETRQSRIHSFNSRQLGAAVFAQLCGDLVYARGVIAAGHNEGMLSMEGAISVVHESRYLLAKLFDLTDLESEEIVSFTVFAWRNGEDAPNLLEDPEGAARFYQQACDLSRNINYENAVARLWSHDYNTSGRSVLVEIWDSELQERVAVDGDVLAAASERTRNEEARAAGVERDFDDEDTPF